MKSYSNPHIKEMYMLNRRPEQKGGETDARPLPDRGAPERKWLYFDVHHISTVQ